MDEKGVTDAGAVANAFNAFLDTYRDFRVDHSLDFKKMDNIYEAIAGALDKLGRCGRQIKHFERNDAKPDWPVGLTENATGLLIYLVMMVGQYDLDWKEGMVKELNKAVEQHADKGE